MKLYYSPGACSLAPHIALREAGIDFSWEKVDLKEKKTETGANFRDVNPKGYVPALEVQPGKVMTEVAVVMQYLADEAADKKLAPAAGSAERYEFLTWLNFVATEIHKGFSPLFKPTVPDEVKETFKGFLALRLDYVNSELGKRDYLLASGFSLADVYLFVTTGWAAKTGVDLNKWPAIVAFRERVAQRPAVQAALSAEGLNG
ncbi:glutathione S-transferase [Pigmentiphaga litoralis]|jgi:glutathione S-transferase|uniref:glutathione transferase GstA n=1 Tax=Pigmentiphaga litoralis TaxID=516702 RepID=UPI00167817B0|nr:glutathione transferase GstA [Pigmentiphaga litoralis]GGX02360.1 glutathione S-transferase [Pigmentiphaga litoralis]